MRTRKTSLENKHLCNCDYFAVILSCSHCTIVTKYDATEIQGAPLKKM